MEDGKSGMDVKGRKPPLKAREIVTILEEERNAKSCVGSQMEAQKTIQEPTRPDTIKTDVTEKKFTHAGTVGFTM
jgi:hypothetical protein